MRTAVVRTGTANLASVLAGLRRAGAEPYVTDQPGDVLREDGVMLPAVGSFGAAMCSSFVNTTLTGLPVARARTMA